MKYTVESPISVGSKNEKGQKVYTRYNPGDVIEISDEQAGVFLAKNAVSPYEEKETKPKATRRKKAVEKVEEDK